MKKCNLKTLKDLSIGDFIIFNNEVKTIKKQIKSSLLFLSFLFLNQLNAITPGQFENSFNKWAFENGLGYSKHKMNCLISTGRSEELQPIDKFIKNLLEKFKNNRILNKFENLKEEKLFLTKLFLFIDTLILNLIKNHQNESLKFQENIKFENIFSDLDITALNLLLSTSYKEKEDISKLIVICCERINTFMAYCVDFTKERRCFYLAITEPLPIYEKINFIKWTGIQQSKEEIKKLKKEFNRQQRTLDPSKKQRK